MGLQRWRWAALIPLFLIVAGVIFLTVGQRDSLSWPEWVLREALAPLQSGVSRVCRGVAKRVDSVVSWRQLVQENAALRKELEEIRARNAELLAAQRENEGLRQALGLLRDKRSTVTVAEVIARTPRSWFSTMTINKGMSSGVTKGMAVVTSEGVVGHIRSVTRHTAEVLLIIDQKSALGARIHRTGEVVLVEGLGSAGDGRALVRSLSRDTDIRQGDYVITSGLSEIYPKGLAVGVIEEIQEGQYGLTRYGVLKPAADLGRLEWVVVLSGQ